MKVYIFQLLVLAQLGLNGLAPWAFASTGGELPCARLLTRQAQSEVQLAKAVEAIWSDTLVREFELEHLKALYTGNETGSINWFRFNPDWVVRDPARLARLLEHLDPTDPHASPGFSPEQVSGFGAAGVIGWLEHWEKGYTRNFAPIAKSWENGGRRRFLQTVLVEAAVRYALREGKGNQPQLFMSAQPQEGSEALVYNELNAGIGIIFRGMEAEFQSRFDAIFRRRQGIGVTGPLASVPVHERNVRTQLRNLGVPLSQIRAWQPRVKAAYRDRDKSGDVEVVVDFVRDNPDCPWPLAVLLREETGVEGLEQSGFSWAELEAVLHRHGSARNFLRVINERLASEKLPQIRPHSGTENSVQELLIQIAHFIAVNSQGPSVRDFKGFQADDVDAVGYFSMYTPVARRANLSMYGINLLVRNRLNL